MADERSLSDWRGWGVCLALPAVVLVTFPPNLPRWTFMWTLAATIFARCKWLTWRRTTTPNVSIGRQLGYLFAWPGMDSTAFLHPNPAEVVRPDRAEWLFAGTKAAIGFALLFTSLRLEIHPHLAGWLAMIGIVMTLHFGLFHLLSCAWRQAGVNARPLMHWPIAAASVSEFWGQCWNRAFRDLTHRFIFRPLTTKFGPRWAIAGGFLFSGIIHDLVISVPARGGYGGPTLFFAVQGVAIFVERSGWGRQIGLSSGWRGWLFTMMVLMTPIPCLFHSHFVLEIVVPFIQAIGG